MSHSIMETFLFNIVISTLLTTLHFCAALVAEDHVEANRLKWFSPVFFMWDMEHEEKKC